MELAIQIQIEELPEGLFLATSDELPGLVAQGRTVAETLEIARGRGAKTDRGAPGARGSSEAPHHKREAGLYDRGRGVNGETGGIPLPRHCKKLRSLGFEFDRQAAGSHEIWFNSSSNRYTTIPNHPGDMPEGTLRAILRQAGVDPQEFLAA